MPPSGMVTPGQTRAPRSSSHRAPISAPSPMTPSRISARGPIRAPKPMIERSIDRARPDVHTVEDHRAVQPRASADLGPAADDRAADQQCARCDGRAVVHQFLAAVPTAARATGRCRGPGPPSPARSPRACPCRANSWSRRTAHPKASESNPGNTSRSTDTARPLGIRSMTSRWNT